MTAIDRTAYPRPGNRLTPEELDARYRLSETDHAFIRATARGDAGRLTLAALLKGRQNLGCFPAPIDIHGNTVRHLASQLGLVGPFALTTEEAGAKTLYRYRAAVRAYLDTSPYADAGEQLVAATVLEAATTMSDPADLINRAIEALGKAATDLPAFSTLERLANHLRAQVHARLYDQVAARLKVGDVAALDALLIVQPRGVTTTFSRLKQTPGPARPETIRLWTDRLDWLIGLVDPDPILEGIAHTKLRQFAAEAAAMEVSELLDMARAGKRHTLLLSLLRQARSRCHDELIEMLLRRVRRTQAVAKEKLKELQDQHRGMEEALIAIFGRVIETANNGETDAEAGHRIRTLLAEQGGIDVLAERCETVSASHNNNDLPLLWPIHANTRSLLFRLLGLMDIRSATQDRSLLDALAVVVARRHAHRDDLAGELDLGFASQRWQSFIVKRGTGGMVLGRRALEVCVFIDADGVPHLKKQPAGTLPEGLAAFETEVHARMPERHLLDILKYSACWTRYTRHFGPPSGADPKLARAEQRYILTVFGYGCNLGPSQTARHAPGIATAETLRRINAQHIDTAKLEAATTDLINGYARFSLPRLWGAGRAAIADGTHVPLRENNLIGAQHIRYGGYGGIAYHHIADSYIALFTSFIPYGVWEAVHILDGLMKNRSAIQPDTLHADTQGQSEPVFGLCRLLGIKLMPRMRNWDDVIFYRPDKSSRYSHIDALFTREIDWRLIATHWRDMMQVVLSIQAGLVLPSMLLRKLGSNNRKSRLCLAFRELGRVERTLFLLRYVSDPQIRRTIRAETTKIESFNDFLDWITFGARSSRAVTRLSRRSSSNTPA
jgi:TnpA family transposase